MPNTNRDSWSNSAQFVLTCVGSMVGLGNIWRFPYICFKNGGGAFLLPYLIFVIILIIPIMFMEFSIGQYSNKGPAKVWLCCPLFKGIGYAMIIVAVIASTYYSVILSWALFYFGNSFHDPLPWTTCDNSWNTKTCYLTQLSNLTRNATYVNDTVILQNITTKVQTSSEEFWEHRVLDLTDSISDIGHLRWELVLCSFITWTCVFLVLIRGVKTLGKFMYFASTVPFILLTILLIRGSLLPGASNGIKYFFIPRWKDLLKFSVWSDAAVQGSYSASLGLGELLNLASHNDFKNNCYRDALVLPLIDLFVSLFAGCVIFTTLGYVAAASNVNIDTVVKQGPGIAFIIYPDALATLPMPQIWSAVFFFLLFLVAINSLAVSIQVITDGLFDSYPHMRPMKKSLATLVICFLGFVSTILYLTGGGMYILQLVDWYLTNIPRTFLVFAETTVIAYLYGTSRLRKNIDTMIGYFPSKIWKYIWLFVTPFMMAFLLIFMFVQHGPVKYGNTPFPSWSVVVGGMITALPFIIVFLGMIHTFWSFKDTLLLRLQKAVKPCQEWEEMHSAESENLREMSETVKFSS